MGHRLETFAPRALNDKQIHPNGYYISLPAHLWLDSAVSPHRTWTWIFQLQRCDRWLPVIVIQYLIFRIGDKSTAVWVIPHTVYQCHNRQFFASASMLETYSFPCGLRFGQYVKFNDARWYRRMFHLSGWASSFTFSLHVSVARTISFPLDGRLHASVVACPLMRASSSRRNDAFWAVTALDQSGTCCICILVHSSCLRFVSVSVSSPSMGFRKCTFTWPSGKRDPNNAHRSTRTRMVVARVTLS